MQRRLLGIFCLCLCGWGVAGAQDVPTSPPTAPAVRAGDSAPAAAAVVEDKPEIFYVFDESGNLVPLINHTLSDIRQLMELKEGLTRQEQVAEYVIQSMRLQGRAGEGHAEFSARFRLLVQQPRWVRIPLRLEEAILIEPEDYQGPGEHLLQFEEGSGYVLWVRGGDEPEQHHLEMRVLVPLTTVGEETRMRLRPPGGVASSEMQLTVPEAEAVGRISEGVRLATDPASDGGTRFSVLGLGSGVVGGEIELAWRASAQAPLDAPVVLSVAAEVHTMIDGRGIDSEAQLEVSSEGAAFDRFRVLLPGEAQWVPGSPSGYIVVPLDGEEVEGRQLVEVQLAEKTTGPVPVRLATRRTHDAAASDEYVELAGFEVLGAAWQEGEVAVAAAPEWHILWGTNPAVQQIDKTPEMSGHEEPVAVFRYFSQPYSLEARVVPRETRISVEPEYLLLVGARQVRLEARLKYVVRGAKTFQVEVDLRGWRVDEVGPSNLVAVERWWQDEAGKLTVPLAQSTGGQFEISLTAHREVHTGGNLRLSLPMPQATFPRTAAVSVLPDDNVELTPQSEHMVGLVRQQVASTMTLPVRQQPPLHYQGHAGGAVFAAELRVHSRTVSAAVQSRISLFDDEDRTEQTLTYTIRYEPLDHLTVMVPGELASYLDEIRFFWEGQRLTPTLAEEDGEEGALRLRLGLPEARIGGGELWVHYPLPPQRIPRAASLERTVPLVMPLDGTLTANRLLVTAPPTVQLEHHNGPWQTLDLDPPLEALGRRYLQLSAEEGVDRVTVGLRMEDGDVLGTTVIHRAWVQTWLTRNARQDRAVFRFTSNERELEIIVPPAAGGGEMVLLDDHPVRLETTADGRTVVPLPDDPTPRERVLEVRFQFARSRPERGAMALEIPRLGDGVWVQRMYWQLVFPLDEHMVGTPAGFTPEFRWGWTGTSWGRVALLQQPALEQWVGAPRLDEVPLRTNRYLFSSSMEPTGPFELRTVARASVVLWASGAALVVGLLWIYIPAVRHPAALFAAAVGLAAATAVYPEPTLLLLQAASLGVVLVLVAAALQRRVTRPRRGVPHSEPTSSVFDRGSTETQYRLAPPAPPLSTESAPATGGAPLTSPK